MELRANKGWLSSLLPTIDSFGPDGGFDRSHADGQIVEQGSTPDLFTVPTSVHRSLISAHEQLQDTKAREPANEVRHRQAGSQRLFDLGAVFLSFVFASMAPGNYFDEMKMNPQISPQTIARFIANTD